MKLDSIRNVWRGKSQVTRISPNQRILAYFVRWSITVRLASCFVCLDSAGLLLFKWTIALLVWSNPNQSNRRSAVQWYFPLWNTKPPFSDSPKHRHRNDLSMMKPEAWQQNSCSTTRKKILFCHRPTTSAMNLLSLREIVGAIFFLFSA